MSATKDSFKEVLAQNIDKEIAKQREVMSKLYQGKASEEVVEGEYRNINELKDMFDGEGELWSRYLALVITKTQLSGNSIQFVADWVKLLSILRRLGSLKMKVETSPK